MALIGSLPLDTLGALAILLVLGYFYATKDNSFFKKRGIPYVRPLPFVGNFGSVLIGRDTFHEAVKPLYNELKKHRIGGIFTGLTPAILVFVIRI